MTPTLKNQNGMTITEMMVAIAASSILILGGATLFMAIMKADAFARRSAETIETAQAMRMNLPLYIGQAVNTVWTNINITNIGGGRGEIRTFRSGRDGSTNVPPTTIAAFIREAGFTSATDPGSDLRATGIYFKNPTATTPGILSVASSGPGTGGVTLNSQTPDQFFDNIVEFEVSPGRIAIQNGQSVRMVTVRAVFRKFLDNQTSLWRWCPAIEMNTVPECQTHALYNDFTELMVIPLTNNVIQSNFQAEDNTYLQGTVYGDVYYYRSGQGGQ